MEAYESDYGKGDVNCWYDLSRCRCDKLVCGEKSCERVERVSFYLKD